MDFLDDDLLALAEGTSTKRKSKSQGAGRSKPKRKRPAHEHEDSASDMDMSSDSDAPPNKARPASDNDGASDDDDAAGDGDDDDEYAEFPLDGQYKDEADRARILAMPELEREGILGDRAETKNAAAQRRDLRRMVKEKERAEGGSGSGNDDTQRSGRERKATGATREKREGLEKLKKRREEKGKQKERKYDDEPDSLRRRASPGAYSDDSGDEEGQLDQYESSTKRSSTKASKKNLGADVAGPADIRSVTVTRTKLAEFCLAPWFESWVKGAWVRYLIGSNTGENVYRLCQVDGVRDFPDRPYIVEGAGNVKTTLQLVLRHGKAVHHFEMAGISDSVPTDKEFGRLSSALSVEGLSLPLQKDVEEVRRNLARRKEYTMTEADLSAALAKKGARVNPAQGKARLLVQRDFARQMNDADLLEKVNAQLALLEAPPSPGGAHESEADRMKKLNERNRADNRKEVKKAETRAQDERRRQAAALARGDEGVKVDASARVKTLTRLHYDRSDTPSRPSTPQPGSPKSGIATPPVVVARHKVNRIEAIAKSVTIDLDDLDF